jgi:RNA polymerase sigma-70 factor (ECF subfamily)
MYRVERDAVIEEETLVDLLCRAQEQQDPQAYDGIYLLYADRVFRYLLVRVEDADFAEEITSQVFVHLIERLHKYRIGPADNVAVFSAWLYRMTYNKMVDIIRKTRRSPQMPIDLFQDMATGQVVIDDVIQKIDNEKLLGTLSLLNETQRDVILLRFIEGYSIAETAQILQKTEGAVKALQHRAVGNLRRHLEDKSL